MEEMKSGFARFLWIYREANLVSCGAFRNFALTCVADHDCSIHTLSPRYFTPTICLKNYKSKK